MVMNHKGQPGACGLFGGTVPESKTVDASIDGIVLRWAPSSGSGAVYAAGKVYLVNVGGLPPSVTSLMESEWVRVAPDEDGTAIVVEVRR